MFRFLTIALLAAGTVACAGGGMTGEQSPSPAATATGSVGGTTLTVEYSAPSVRGRQIFGPGNLLSRDPTYPVWRAGANAATTFRTDADVMLGDLRVPRGTYTLYVNVGDPDAWELVVSRQTGQWGLEYDATQDLGRVKMVMSQPASLVETLRYEIRDGGAGTGELRLLWENRVASVPVAPA